MNFADLARRAGKLAIDNSPTILTSIGVVGAITTAFLAVKASFKTAGELDLNEWSTLTPKEKVEVIKETGVWKNYVPAVSVCTATIICIIGANHVGSRRAAGLAAAYTISEKTFEEYKAKVTEKFGERKETAVHDEVIQDRVTKKAFLDDAVILGLDEGQLCYDTWSDRYFRNTVEGVRAAENDLNHALIHDNYASLDEFYNMLGLPSPAYAHQVGWNSDKLLEVRITSVLAPGDIPCIAISFKTEPGPDYGRFR